MIEYLSHGFIQPFKCLQFDTRLDKRLSSLGVTERSVVVLEDNLESCIIEQAYIY